jgi:vacuolar-type H+-ATPase subunit I/STV1
MARCFSPVILYRLEDDTASFILKYVVTQGESNIMNTKEEFIEKIMRGEDVRVQEIAKSQLQLELTKLKSIAAQRLEDEKAERERINRRKLEISELLELDTETQQLSDQLDENFRHFLEAMQPFADRELEIRAASNKAWLKFNQLYHKLNGAAYNHPFTKTPLTIELKEMGAVLTAIDDPLHKSPLSPLTRMVLNYREDGKY